MNPDLVQAVSHVALQVTDVDASSEFASALIGLRESGRSADRVFLTHDDSHHSVEYISGETNALDHMGFEVTGPEALREIRSRVENAGLEIVEEDLAGPIEDGFLFVGPDGFGIEVHLPMGKAGQVPLGVAAAPNRLGHFNINPVEVEPSRRMYSDVLGFLVSDWVGDGDGCFMRCNTDHHAIAIVPGPGTFHHQAWEVKSIADLARAADLLNERGQRTLWGPVRHGVGNNIAVYFREPAGDVIELYTDMDKIETSDAEPGHWDPTDPLWYSRWTDFRPSDFRTFGVPASERKQS
jgi:catechol-2,3-dioxygenase